MRIPERLEPLVDQGILDEVVRPLMAGKEAQVFLVVARGAPAVAKVYKDATHRSFKHRADYTEGRRTRNTRDMRAMAKRSRYGREQAEDAWRSAEVDAIYKLSAYGVRVPRPYDFVDGVLVMELVGDGTGGPAPRLVDVELHPNEAHDLFHDLLREVQAMLCAGVVHGDLSDFNILLSPDGPVIIDFPQAVDPAHNNNARKLLIRDVDNLTKFLGRYAPELRRRPFGEEMWDLYERGQLTPETELTGRWRPKRGADVSGLLAEIEALEAENRRRREALGLAPSRPARAPVAFDAPPPRPVGEGGSKGKGPKPQKAVTPMITPTETGPAEPSGAAKKRRRRRRKRGSGGGAASGPPPSPRDELDALLLVEDD